MKNPALWQEMGHFNTKLGGNQAKCEKVVTLSFSIQELADKINDLQGPICQCCANCATEKDCYQTLQSEMLSFNIINMINLK